MLKPPDEKLSRNAKQHIPSWSHWDDPVWEWVGGSPGTASDLKRLRWNFKMADGSRFSDPQWAEWAQTMKIAIWSLAADPPADRRPLRIASLHIMHRNMRTLVEWMHCHGYRRLNQLTRTGQRAFIRDVKGGKAGGKGKAPLKIQTMVKFQNTLQLLFLQGRRYPQIAIEEPAPQDAISVAQVAATGGGIPRTPDEIAMVLIRGAIRLLGPPAEDIIEARDRVQTVHEEAVSRGTSLSNVWAYERKKLTATPPRWERSTNESWYRKDMYKPSEVRGMANRLCDAAFVVLSYLVGMRASEILALETGCVTKRPSLAGDETFTFINGRIYKTAPTAEGVRHAWVAPPIAERAIEVLERVSRPVRAETGKRNLWLNAVSKGVSIPRPFFVLLALFASWAAGAMVWSAKHASGRQDPLRVVSASGRGRVLV